jgi:hypothetical protein
VGERRPLFGDVPDIDALRGWAKTNNDNEVVLTGRLRSAFAYVMEGASEHLPIDDFARGIAAQGPTEAMAFLTPAVIEIGGVTRRCFKMLVERAGRVGQLVMPLENKDGKIAGGPLKFRDEGPVPPGGRWNGVPPEREVSLTVAGPVDGKELPEG